MILRNLRVLGFQLKKLKGEKLYQIKQVNLYGLTKLP